MQVDDSSKFLLGKNVIVTGASMGVGRAVALELASRGASVVVNASGGGVGNISALNQLVAEIESCGGRAYAHCGPVDDFQYAGELVGTTESQLGSVDGLINMAGVAEPRGSSILTIDQQDWSRVISVHLNGTFNLCRHVAPVMVKQQSGVIINTGSHAFLGIYGGSAYAAAKGAIVSFTAAISADLNPCGIRCNVVNPGAKTRLSSGEEFQREMLSLYERGLLDDSRYQSALNPAPPEYIAPLYSYLFSVQAKHINNQVVSASGRHLGCFTRSSEQVLCYRESLEAGPWKMSEISGAYSAMD